MLRVWEEVGGDVNFKLVYYLRTSCITPPEPPVAENRALGTVPGTAGAVSEGVSLCSGAWPGSPGGRRQSGSTGLGLCRQAQGLRGSGDSSALVHLLLRCSGFLGMSRLHAHHSLVLPFILNTATSKPPPRGPGADKPFRRWGTAPPAPNPNWTSRSHSLGGPAFLESGVSCKTREDPGRVGTPRPPPLRALLPGRRATAGPTPSPGHGVVPPTSALPGNATSSRSKFHRPFVLPESP